LLTVPDLALALERNSLRCPVLAESTIWPAPAQ
jgi:hypothetical protein